MTNREKNKQNLSKKKIINSAIVLFANKGFDSATTREICKHAGVNLSLIPYYFGNKEGLYINIIDSILNYGLAYMQEELSQSNNINALSTNEKIILYRTLLEKYVDFLYSENVPSSFVALMVKEQTVSHNKFSDIYSQKISIYYNALRRILASILNKKETDKAIIYEVSSIIGQVLGYKLMNRATLDAMGQDLYTKDDNKKIKNIVLSYVDTTLEKISKKITSDVLR